MKKILLLLHATTILMALLVAYGSDQEASTSAGKTDFKGEGYAEPEIILGFEEKYGAKINPTYFGSSDELLKVGGGSTYEIRNY